MIKTLLFQKVSFAVQQKELVKVNIHQPDNNKIVVCSAYKLYSLDGEYLGWFFGIEQDGESKINRAIVPGSIAAKYFGMPFRQGEDEDNLPKVSVRQMSLI